MMNNLLYKFDEKEIDLIKKQSFVIDNTLLIKANNAFGSLNNYEKFSNYENVLFSYPEEFFNYATLPQIEDWILAGKNIYFKTFTWGFVEYLQNRFGEQIKGFSIKELFKFAFHHIPKTNLEPNNKKILLNWLCARRTPARDYVYKKIILDNNLHLNDKNFITFHNLAYNSYEIYSEQTVKNYINNFELDIKNFDTIGSKEEKQFVFGEQHKQQNRVNEIYNNSMFNIITEPSHPYSNDVSDIWSYCCCLTRRTTYPLFRKNVFYIPKYSEKYNQCLKDLGFEIFFENEDEFLKNLNEDFYYNKETQEKLEYNYNNCMDLVKR